MLQIWKSSRTSGWRDKCNKFTLTLTPPPRDSRKNIFGNAVKRVEIRQIYPLKRASLGLFRFPWLIRVGLDISGERERERERPRTRVRFHHKTCTLLRSRCVWMWAGWVAICNANDNTAYRTKTRTQAHRGSRKRNGVPKRERERKGHGKNRKRIVCRDSAPPITSFSLRFRGIIFPKTCTKQSAALLRHCYGTRLRMIVQKLEFSPSDFIGK